MPRIPKVPRNIRAEVIEALRTQEECKAAAKRYSDAKDDIKRLLRDYAFNDGKPIAAASAGDYTLTFYFGSKTTYPVPDDVKAKYKKTEDNGRFVPSFVRSPG